MACCVHPQRASGARLRNGADAGRRRPSGALRVRLHQRHDHRDPARREARNRSVGAGQVPDDGRPSAGSSLERPAERADDDELAALEGDRPGRALRAVPQDLRAPEVGNVADSRVGAGVHERSAALLPAVPSRKRQGPCGWVEEARQAARRPGRTGQGRRRGAVSQGSIADAGAGASVSAVPLRTRARRRADWRRRRLVLLLMSPWIVGFTVFFAYPLVMSAYLSFNHYDLLSPPRWVGWANYHYLLRLDPQTWTAVKNTLIWMVAIAVPLQVLFAFSIATLLARAKSGGGFFRTVFYLPALAPPVAATLGFVYILNPATGPVNTILGHLGINGPLWFQDPSWAKPSLVMLGLWGVGNTMVIFLAAVLDVPSHLYESAELDGAGWFLRLRWVTLPTISPVILFAVILGVIQGLQYFTQAYVAANIASGQASQAADVTSNLGYPEQSTLFYPVLLYQNGFRYFQMGYASAMAIVLLAVSFAITLFVILNSRRWVHYGRGVR